MEFNVEWLPQHSRATVAKTPSKRGLRESWGKI